MTTQNLSNLDLVSACDNFPYTGLAEQCYKLYLPHDDQCHGYILPSNISRIPWTSDFHIDRQALTVKLVDPSSSTNSTSSTSTFCTSTFATILQTSIDQNIFSTIHGQHSEPFSIPGALYPVSIERFASDIFGIISRGAHLTVYTHSSSQGYRIWVPRRGEQMFTYPNKLDTTVAGGVKADQTPWENVIQEADEEASLSADLIRGGAKAAGVLSYIEYSAEAAGGEDCLVAPNLVYVFDLEVGEDVVPTPKDGEVKEFTLMSVEEVRQSLRRGEWKTNSAVVMLDFFIRHGLITAENEVDFAEIIMRMHRRLPFPTSRRR